MLSTGAFLASTNPTVRAAADKKNAIEAEARAAEAQKKKVDKAVSIAEKRAEEVEKQEGKLPSDIDTEEMLQNERELASQELIKAYEQRYAINPNSEDFLKIFEEKKFLKEMEDLRKSGIEWEQSKLKGNARAEEIRTQ